MLARILIAENELALREFIARGFGLRGHEVTMSPDGSEALELLRRRKFDVLLTDIDMPIMDGIDLSLNATRLDPELKIVVMSGHEHQLERARAMPDVVQRVISKPFTIAEICEVVEGVLNGADDRATALRGKSKTRSRKTPRPV
jgi:CheY-like chemotaxis protein